MQTATGAVLQHVYPAGFTEVVPKYRAIGHGEPYGSLIMKILWHPEMKMKQVAELGYYIIKHVEKFELDSSVGVGNNKPQIWFIPDEGNLEQVGIKLLDKFEIRYKRWAQQLQNYLIESFRVLPELDEYIVVGSWGSFCRMEDGFGCIKDSPGAHERGDGQFYYTEGIDIDSSGNVYVAEQGNDRVQKFDSNGNFIAKWGGLGKKDGQFDVAYALAIDSNDCVYVSDSDNCRIQKFDSNGNFIVKWGSYGKKDGQFSSPHAIAVDSSDNIYVTEETNHRIQKFDSNGNFIAKWGSFCSIEEHSGWNEDSPGAIEPGDGQFNHPIGIIIDRTGFVYVADHMNHRIQKFDSNGNFIAKWGSYGKKDGQFNRPHGITVDGSDRLYITDSLNARIQKFSIDGEFITKWGSQGNGEGQFSVPRDLVVSRTSTVFVSDGSNHRIQVFAHESYD
jgi:DNA-binding beta-propeller fold protein YncE